MSGLAPGRRLGIFDVGELLGEGGMGKVYQARDTKLDRDVALKVLPEAFTSDPDRLARFEREAKVLASLNHPNIGSIYGLEEAAGVRALVLELIDGPTLADRIKQGPIPIDEALPIAKQIAEALEAAHEQGVIHRDLKPANVKVKDDGTVKVLDFGLAKALDPTSASATADPSNSPTLTAAATQMGVILGTAAYMSPEQARGKAVDRRADIWSFGAVLYEMLTGRRPFEGRDASETLAAVIQSDPDWEALDAQSPPRLSNVVRRCLDKEPRRRVQAVGDVRLAMDGAFEATTGADSEPIVAPRLRVWQRPMPAAIGALLVAAVAGLGVWSFTRPLTEPERVARFPIPLPDEQAFGGVTSQFVAIAPTGDRLAFVGTDGIWLRALDQMDASLVSGAETAYVPFFSFDGQWLGFWTDGQLQRVSISGGPPVALGAAEYLYGVSWGVDDTILFGQSDGIWQVPGTGGTPERVIPIEDGEAVYGPQMLPGDDQVLFTLRPAGTGSWDQAQIVVESLANGERSVLIDGGRDARYLSTGHLVYALEGTLLVQVFDVDELVMVGGAVALVEGVRTTPYGQSGATQFGVSRDGVLAYVSGSYADYESDLVWVDHEGREQRLEIPAAAYSQPRVSSDGTKVVASIQGDEARSIWIADATRGTLGRITSAAANEGAPIWTPDGRHVVFTSDRDGGRDAFYRKSADGTGEVEHLATIDGEGLRAGNWSPDGSHLVFSLYRDGATTTTDIGVLSMETERSWRLLLETDADEFGPAISPDGRWLAYVSDETGNHEVYVARFPDLGDRQQVSTDGGLDPLWSPDGRELYYLGTGGAEPYEMRLVSIAPGPPFSVGHSEVLFSRATVVRPTSAARFHDIASDGQRFLFLSPQSAGAGAVVSPQINVVLNWTQELLERVPVP